MCNQAITIKVFVSITVPCWSPSRVSFTRQPMGAGAIGKPHAVARASISDAMPDIFNSCPGEAYGPPEFIRSCRKGSCMGGYKGKVPRWNFLIMSLWRTGHGLQHQGSTTVAIEKSQTAKISIETQPRLSRSWSEAPARTFAWACEGSNTKPVRATRYLNTPPTVPGWNL